MSATGSLSPEQKATLRSIFLLLRTARPLLALLADRAGDATDRFSLESNVRLFHYAEERLVRAFPDLVPLAEEWKARGGL